MSTSYERHTKEYGMPQCPICGKDAAYICPDDWVRCQDAIHSLEAQVKEADKENDAYDFRLEELSKQNARLREALEKIIKYFEAMMGENEIPKNYVYDTAKSCLQQLSNQGDGK